jgi:DNA-binding MarR family transcriptional regulator
LESKEGIATNILASRLDRLEQIGILIRKPHDTDRRKEVYSLTEKGLDLIAILLEMAGWSAQHDPQTGAPADWIATIHADKERVTRLIRKTVQNGGSIFVGPDSVYRQLMGKP